MGTFFPHLVQNAWAFIDKHGQGVAALAALIGIPVLLWQIFQNARRERRRLRRRNLAALATLPLTLNSVMDWARAAARAMSEVYPREGHVIVGETFRPPRVPIELIQSVERMIEATPRTKVAQTLAAIVSDIQVLSARMADFDEYKPENLHGNTENIDDCLILALPYIQGQNPYLSLLEKFPKRCHRISIKWPSRSIGWGCGKGASMRRMRCWGAGPPERHAGGLPG